MLAIQKYMAGHKRAAQLEAEAASLEDGEIEDGELPGWQDMVHEQQHGTGKVRCWVLHVCCVGTVVPRQHSVIELSLLPHR